MSRTDWDASGYVLSGLAGTAFLLLVAGTTNVVAWTWLAAIWALIAAAVRINAKR